MLAAAELACTMTAAVWTKAKTDDALQVSMLVWAKEFVDHKIFYVLLFFGNLIYEMQVSYTGGIMVVEPNQRSMLSLSSACL